MIKTMKRLFLEGTNHHYALIVYGAFISADLIEWIVNLMNPTRSIGGTIFILFFASVFLFILIEYLTGQLLSLDSRILKILHGVFLCIYIVTSYCYSTWMFGSEGFNYFTSQTIFVIAIYEATTFIPLLKSEHI